MAFRVKLDIKRDIVLTIELNTTSAESEKPWARPRSVHQAWLGLAAAVYCCAYKNARAGR